MTASGAPRLRVVIPGGSGQAGTILARALHADGHDVVVPRGTRVGLPATRWMLELGAIALRTETELVPKSRRVVPGRLPASGFEFGHPVWPEAARELCRRWRATRDRISEWAPAR